MTNKEAKKSTEIVNEDLLTPTTTKNLHDSAYFSQPSTSSAQTSSQGVGFRQHKRAVSRISNVSFFKRNVTLF